MAAVPHVGRDPLTVVAETIALLEARRTSLAEMAIRGRRLLELHDEYQLLAIGQARQIESWIASSWGLLVTLRSLGAFFAYR